MSDSDYRLIQMQRQINELQALLDELKTREFPTRATGTFTPILGGSTTDGTLTYSVQAGTYVRIGNVVLAWFTVVVATVTATPTGTLRIGALPFTARSGNPNGTTSIGFANIATLDHAVVSAGATYCTCFDDTGTGTNGTTVAIGTNIQGCAIYEVA